jgi:uncharacterized membrane protein HdeD (DUF308 family)
MDSFSRSWEVYLVRGIVAIGLGLIAFAWPGRTVGALLVVLAGYAVVDGALAVLCGTRERARRRAWALAVEGLVGVSIGALALVVTKLALLPLVPLLCGWSIATGILEILAGLRTAKAERPDLTLAIAGTMSVLVGIALLGTPGAPAFVLVMLIGLYGAVFGGAMLLRASIGLRRNDEAS